MVKHAVHNYTNAHRTMCQLLHSHGLRRRHSVGLDTRMACTAELLMHVQCTSGCYVRVHVSVCRQA